MRQSLRAAIQASLQDVPATEFQPGTRVRVLCDRFKLYPGAISEVREVDGCKLFTVAYDDGDVHNDVKEDELRLDTMDPCSPTHKNASGKWLGELPSEAIIPSDEQIAALPSPAVPLPPENLAKELHPDGSRHCGGDFCLPNLTLAHPELSSPYRMPLFLMAPGATVAFSGATLCHGTSAHHAVASRSSGPGGAAHVSFAVQTPALTLGMNNESAERRALHNKLVDAGAVDALSSEWQPPSAVCLPVWHFESVASPSGKLWYDEARMCALKWERIVLYNIETGAPLVFYHRHGGLRGAAASLARRHFGFLHDEWRFSLNRHCGESGTSGCLHLDLQGDQRMEMLGCHSRGRNKSTPPDRARKWLEVANRGGDLDAYVVHMDEGERFGGEEVKQVWNEMSRCMHAMLPKACAEAVQALEDARVRERLYSALAIDTLSDDLLVNNVGVSAAYQSPPHFDVGDVGWTFAFAVKCDHDEEVDEAACGGGGGGGEGSSSSSHWSCANDCSSSSDVGGAAPGAGTGVEVGVGARESSDSSSSEDEEPLSKRWRRAAELQQQAGAGRG